MKPKKKKFDIKAFFINHCEKFVFVAMIPLAIYIGIQGTKFVPLPWQPEALQKAADESEAFIKKNERSAAEEGVSVTNYDVKAEWIKVPLRSQLYLTDTKWMPSLFREKIKRTGVEVFTVADLKASTGLGAVKVNSNIPEAQDFGIAPGTTQVGRRWVVLTGLVPIKKQLDLYVSTYSQTIFTDPVHDTPQYFYYDIERAEVLPNSNVNNLEWKKLDFYKSYGKDLRILAGVSLDPVDPTFLAPLPGTGLALPMAYPLPPVDKRFGEEVTHPPVIPMLTDSQMMAMKLEEKFHKEEIRRSIEAIDERSILGADPFAGRTQDVNRRQQEEPDEESLVTVTDYLFRFFDYTVEIGKSYRYRARLYLANPNYNLAEKLLEDPNLRKEPFLITPYSASSPTITVPLGSRVLTNGVTAANPRIPWAEPTTSLYAVYFDMDDGSEWYLERKIVNRGQTINYAKQEVLPFVSDAPQADMLDGGGPQPRPGDRRPPLPRPGAKPALPSADKKTVDVVSNVCILDMIGGSLLAKVGTGNTPDLRSPGKIVVLEPSGAMVVRKVDTDSAEIERLKNPTPAFGSNVIGSPSGGDGRMGSGSP